MTNSGQVARKESKNLLLLKKISSMQKLCFFSCLILMLLIGQSCKKDDDSNQSVLSELDKNLLAALENTSNGTGNAAYVLPESNDFDNIPQDPNNPLNDAKVVLGKLLFHEPALAIFARKPQGLNTYSCATCHNAAAGFQAGRAQGLGEGGKGFGTYGEGRELDPTYSTAFLDVQPIKSPSILNVAYQTNMLYNGQFGATGVNTGTETFWTLNTPKQANFLGYEGVESQAIGGQTEHLQGIDASFFEGNETYKNLFNEAFSDLPENQRMNDTTSGLALAAWERTVFPQQAAFQRWLKGDYTAMTEQEKTGAVLFFGKAGCYECHNGPALNSMAFYGLGMNDLIGPGIFGSEPSNGPTNRGRGGFNSNADDDYKFKVPQLYNLKDSPFYGHGSTFSSIYDVVAYKNAAIPENSAVPATQLAEQFVPLGLSESEVEAITVFIEDALHDGNLTRYVPESLPSEYCFPNNDAQSQIDLGCQ